ncbi:TetR/AcrR family transcriptional regulator [Micromonosporaceae bacterium Da 78-11]
MATTTNPRLRGQRSDAVTNREGLVRAATAAVHREGPRVPMATIAADAGVGIATLYRHFPTRDQLLADLTHRSFERVLSNAQTADRAASSGIDALRRFIQAAVDQRNELVLPLHGGPPVSSAHTLAVRDRVHRAISHMIECGHQDGTINREVTARDIITLGAMLAQPRQPDLGWEATCGRLLDTYLDGLSAG